MGVQGSSRSMVFLRRAADAAGYAAVCPFDEAPPGRRRAMFPTFASAGVFSAALATLILMF